jgi:hypothetical protein
MSIGVNSQYLTGGRPLDALWVGGPPGKTFHNLKAKLARIGIMVFQQSDSAAFIRKGNVPAQAQLLILNMNMSDHEGTVQGKKKARASGIPWVYGANALSVILKNLQMKGIVRKDSDLSKVLATCKLTREQPIPLKPRSPMPPSYNDRFDQALHTFAESVSERQGIKFH